MFDNSHTPNTTIAAAMTAVTTRSNSSGLPVKQQ